MTKISESQDALPPKHSVSRDLERACAELEEVYRDSDLAPVVEYLTGYSRSHARRFEDLSERICATVSPSAAVLDVGFNPILTHMYMGGGITDVALAGFNLLPQGIRPEQRHWKIRGQEIPTHYFNLERNIAPYENESFDSILCFEVIEHMSLDPMWAMSEMNRVARPGGKLLLSMPNIASLRAMTLIAEGRSPYVSSKFQRRLNADRHNREYTANEVALLVEAAGFDVEEISTADFYSASTKSETAERLLAAMGGEFEHSGDTVIVEGKKVSSVRDRYPSWLYLDTPATDSEMLERRLDEYASAIAYGHESRIASVLDELRKYTPQTMEDWFRRATPFFERKRFRSALHDIEQGLLCENHGHCSEDRIHQAFIALQQSLVELQDRALARTTLDHLSPKYSSLESYKAIERLLPAK